MKTDLWHNSNIDVLSVLQDDKLLMSAGGESQRKDDESDMLGTEEDQRSETKATEFSKVIKAEGGGEKAQGTASLALVVGVRRMLVVMYVPIPPSLNHRQLEEVDEEVEDEGLAWIAVFPTRQVPEPPTSR